jgi:hypothetical protein
LPTVQIPSLVAGRREKKKNEREREREREKRDQRKAREFVFLKDVSRAWINFVD